MKKKYHFLLPLLLAIFTALGMLLGSLFSSDQSYTPLQKESYRKIDQLLEIIEQSYVDTPQHGDLVELAIKEILDELDPYSTYISADQIAHVNAQLEGSFEGIGVEFNILRDTLMVVAPIQGGPSEKLGIRSGDKIVEVDGKNIAGVSISTGEVRTMLMGPKGTKVRVGIKRNGMNELLHFTITRDKIPVSSIDAAYMLDNSIGLVKISRFAENTYERFEKAMEDLSAQGMEDLVLDLRGNPGGYLGQAVSMANAFLRKGELIVYTEGRKRERDNYEASGTGVFQKGRLVVLIGEGSASASEIVAGAMQDLDRGLIVGRRSHGKGTVQEPMTLLDGSAVRLTVARYYTPSGRSIQRDYEDVRLHDVAHADLDSNRKVFQTTAGRTVREGGGILPDLIVPMDTTMVSAWLNRLLMGGHIQNFASSQVDARRKAMKEAYPQFQDFNDKFTLGLAEWEAFKGYLAKSGISWSDSSFMRAEPYLRNQMRAFYARALFGSERFYQVLHQADDVVQAATNALQDGTYQELNLRQ